jgi:CBS domain containing-hemolysin-like protein
LLDLEEPEITPEELVRLDDRDREMLRSILRLDVLTAREVMAPRLDMVAAEINSPLSEIANLIVRSGHSRIPIYEETLDRVIGVVHSRDLLAQLSERPETSLRELIRPAFFIPETKPLSDLLRELQQKAIQLAIVVDEYGGTEGLVTMEDLLEEIVGELEDEFSRAEELVTHQPDGSVLVDAGVTTEEVEELFGTQLHDPDVDTVGGYVYRALGRIPQVGDSVSTDHLRIEVAAILGRRLRKLRITRQEGVNTSRGTHPS